MQMTRGRAVGLIPIEPTCLAYYAKENGYFDRAGIDVQIAENPSSPAIAATFRRC